MASFSVASRLFDDDQPMPMSTVHTWAGGGNTSPDLSWSGAPAGTQSFAVSMYDPDAPTTVGFVHWVLFNLPPSVTSLEAGAGAAGKNPSDSVLGYTDWGNSEYGGPLPPPGDPPHHYQITVYALDLPKLDLGPNTTYAFFRFSILGHVLGEARLTGRFGR
ncbi:MAG: YbhB/YbcL family Raf kinase inhibitor-like protein [Chloroflexi bacterium]|nr:YbhB/YbcL family Raf kinase inhibitor-like protein [Chloroflexota bacterium]